MKRSFIAISAAIATFGAAGIAHAEELKTEVEFSPIQLATESGRAALREDINDAIDRVCQVSNTRDISQLREQRECRANAAAAAQAQIESKLAALGERRMAYVQTITVAGR